MYWCEYIFSENVSRVVPLAITWNRTPIVTSWQLRFIKTRYFLQTTNFYSESLVVTLNQYQTVQRQQDKCGVYSSHHHPKKKPVHETRSSLAVSVVRFVNHSKLIRVRMQKFYSVCTDGGDMAVFCTCGENIILNDFCYPAPILSRFSLGILCLMLYLLLSLTEPWAQNI